MLKAVFFDMDGVIVDTERDGHRVAFNKAFAEFGLGFEWNAEEYHALLQTGGGKERIAFYLKKIDFKGNDYISDAEALIRKIHKRKTEIFVELITSGELPLRPGVKRLMKEINKEGLYLGICTTSNENSAKAVMKSLLSDIKFDLLIAGDMVSKKKPDPEIYLSAISKAGISANEGYVIEDSHIGVTAARTAGLNVTATVNSYTEDEDVYAANMVVNCLGEPSGPDAKLKGEKFPSGFKNFVDLELLKNNLF
ncbi:MAG: HAD-IA family hydrolase [Spirochaetales bacterium]|nr:HAD-IA family hydrolase [Spirochaetales bacterium]